MQYVVPWAALLSPLRCTVPWPGMHSTHSFGKERELCAPGENGVNTCWVWVDQWSPPHCLLRCLLSVTSLLLRSLSLALFSSVSFCFWRLSVYEGNEGKCNMIQCRLTCAPSSDQSWGHPHLLCVPKLELWDINLSALVKNLPLQIFPAEVRLSGIMDKAFTVIASSHYSWGHKKPQCSFSKGFGPCHHPLGATERFS